MLGFVQNIFSSKCNPIGVDFGSDCLRLAQLQASGADYRMIAAATADVPTTARHDPGARLNFFVEAIRDLLAAGKFRGRQAVLGLPASTMFIQHLRMPKLDPDAMKKALPWELRGKLPIDPSHAFIRHVVAGDVYEGQEPKSEVVVMAASKESVNQYLAAAARAKLDVIGMNVEPKALIDCFTQIYRRKSDEGVINCFVDIGCVATRAVIAEGETMLFARTIPVGGDHFSRAVSQTLKIKMDEAKLLRVKIAQMQPPQDDRRGKEATGREADAPAEESFALLSAGLNRKPSAEEVSPEQGAVATATAPAARATPAEEQLAQQARRVEDACREPLGRLIEELELCRRYQEATFPQKPVGRLIFVGGEARQKMLCQQIARQMGLAAQVGDPLVRVGKNAELGIECGIDRRQPQPGWAVAVGLSMGPGPSSGPVEQPK